jgi:uncharacterized phage-associated protein
MIVQFPPYDARVLANRFLSRAQRDGERLDHLKLQKLLFLLQGWSLVFAGRPIIRDSIEAWEYGPVIPSVYRTFKEFGNRPINEPAVWVATDPFTGPTLVPFDASLANEEEQLIERVWQTYRPYSGLQLSSLTHEDGMAWHIVKTQDPAARSAMIPNDLIQREFQKRLEAANAGRQAG